MDYQGDLKPFVHQLAEVAGYEVRTYGRSSLLTPINVQADDRSIGELLADAGYQASWRCQLVVDPSRRVVDILYDHRRPPSARAGHRSGGGAREVTDAILFTSRAMGTADGHRFDGRWRVALNLGGVRVGLGAPVTIDPAPSSEATHDDQGPLRLEDVKAAVRSPMTRSTRSGPRPRKKPPWPTGAGGCTPARGKSINCWTKRPGCSIGISRSRR